MNKVNKQTKAQYKNLLQCGNGAGVLHYKSANNCVTSLEFYISPKGQLCYAMTGKPITLQVTDLLDDDTGITTITVAGTMTPAE
jgi:hypothetical protein